MRAGVEPGIDDAVRVRLQRTAEAGAALARRLVAGGTIGLLPLRRRQRGIVRRLRRTLERRPAAFSSSAMRASAASNCPTSGSSDRMRASFSATVSLLRSISGVTRSLNRAARDRVNHHSTVRQSSVQSAPPDIGPTKVSNYHNRGRWQSTRRYGKSSLLRFRSARQHSARPILRSKNVGTNHAEPRGLFSPPSQPQGPGGPTRRNSTSSGELACRGRLK